MAAPKKWAQTREEKEKGGKKFCLPPGKNKSRIVKEMGFKNQWPEQGPKKRVKSHQPPIIEEWSISSQSHGLYHWGLIILVCTLN